MMKYIKILLVNLLFIFLVAPAFAIDPITPPVEDAVITNHSNIEVIGALIEDEDYLFDYSSGTVTVTVDDATIYESPVDSAIMRWEDDIDATDGVATMGKDFSSCLSEENEPDVEVTKDISYISTSLAGRLVSTEKGEAGIGHCEGLDEYVESDNVCIVANEACWDVVAGSHLNVTSLSSHSNTALNVTEIPSVKHSITASGEGLIESEMRVVQGEGGRALLDFCSQIPHRGVVQRVTFHDYTRASGIFSNFSKDMQASVKIPEMPIAPVFTAITLCPWH